MHCMSVFDIIIWSMQNIVIIGTSVNKQSVHNHRKHHLINRLCRALSNTVLHACMVVAIAMTDSSRLNTTVETFSTVISFIVLADVMIAVIALVLLVVLVVMCRRMKKGR